MKGNKIGMFLNILQKLRNAIVKTAMEEAPQVRKKKKDLERQQERRKEKEKEEYQGEIQKRARQRQKAIHYFNLYKGNTCWKSI